MSSRERFNGRTGAVSLTFDDGTLSQLEHAVPILNQAGIKGTFYLHARDSLLENHSDDWRTVAQQGHEIGNHTRSHRCPKSVADRHGLEDMTLDEIERDILDAQVLLRDLAPHQESWTFAYPCYSTFIGRGAHRKSYVPIVDRHFVAGRAGGEIGYANDPAIMDQACLWGTPVHDMSAGATIALVDDLTRRGLWVVLVYHDIEGDVLSVPNDSLKAVADYLAREQARLLIAPVRDVIGWL